jgi:hypothetical protein
VRAARLRLRFRLRLRLRLRFRLRFRFRFRFRLRLRLRFRFRLRLRPRAWSLARFFAAAPGALGHRPDCGCWPSRRQILAAGPSQRRPKRVFRASGANAAVAATR